MAEQEHNITGLVIFDRPIQIEEKTIYGIVYDKKAEQRNAENGNDISDYVSYLVGVENFLKHGGIISNDGNIWFHPNGIHELLYNHPLQRLLEVLMRDIVKIQVIEYDQPIEWNEDEVDDDSNPCFILNPALIDRYTKTNDRDELHN